MDQVGRAVLKRADLVARGILPKQVGYMKQLPKDFIMCTSVTSVEWRLIPLWIQVRYEYVPFNGYHQLIYPM